jgi:hypothetical protein
MKSKKMALGPNDKKPHLVTSPTKTAKADKHKAHKAPARATGYSRGGVVTSNKCNPVLVKAGASYTGKGK